MDFKHQNYGKGTVFPRNLATTRFSFNRAATIRERRLQRSTRMRAHSLYLYAPVMRVRIHNNIIVVDPVPCGEISRAAFYIGMSWLKYAATFQGAARFEIRYIIY